METILASLIQAITENVFGALIEASDLSDWFRRCLGRNPEKLAFQQALTQALIDSATRYPGSDLRYFAEILHDSGSSLLERALKPAAILPTADELTTLWINHLKADSLRQYRDKFHAFASFFLQCFFDHLENQQALHWVFQARRERGMEEAIRRLAEASDQLAANYAAQQQTLAQLLIQLTAQQTGRRPSATIGNRFIDGLSRTPNCYSGNITNFLVEYLGSRRQSVPFGGRQTELDALNHWLDDPQAPSYALMVAQAGRGKSALVTRWCAQLITQPDLDVVFVPISIRFSTAGQDVAFTTLAARLAHIYEEPVALQKTMTAGQWKEQCQFYLQQTPPGERRLLVVLDGLDEAVGWTIGPEFFPKLPPDRVRALVTARPLGKKSDTTRWAASLGWEDDTLALKMDLRGLDQTGIEAMLASMNYPLDKLTTQVSVPEELARLSQGDPLLIRLYVDALTKQGTQASRLHPEDLPYLKPRLAGFMEKWWDDQKKQWMDAGKEVDAAVEKLQPLLDVCTIAYGPLSHNDLAELDRQHFGNTLLVAQWVESLGRLVIGDGHEQGYVFGHTLLRDYFAEQMNEWSQAEWQRKFCDWGKRVLTDLNMGVRDPGKTPEYLLRYYTIHLQESNAPAEEFYALISNGWRLAWECVDVTNGGFLDDVNSAWQMARQSYDPRQSGRSQHLIQQVRAALCHSTIFTLKNNFPDNVLVLAVKYRFYTPTQALAIVKTLPEDSKRGFALSALALYLPTELLDEALSIAYEVREAYGRTLALAKLSYRLPRPQRLEVLAEALRSAYMVEGGKKRDSDLLTLVAHLHPEPERTTMLEKLFDGHFTTSSQTPSVFAPLLPPHLLKKAWEVDYSVFGFRHETPIDRADRLSQLLGYLPHSEQDAAISDLLEIVSTDEIKIRTPFNHQTAESDTPKKDQVQLYQHVKILSQLASATSGIKQTEILKQAWSKVEEITDPYELAQSLICLVRLTSEQEEKDIWQRILVCAFAVKRELHLEWTLNSLHKSLPDSLLHEAITLIDKVNNLSTRAKLLAQFAERFPLSECLPIIREAIRIASTSNDPSEPLAYEFALTGGGEFLSGNERITLFTQALSYVQKLEDLEQNKAIATLVAHLPDELMTKALQIIDAFGKEVRRKSALIALASKLSPERLVHHLDKLLQRIFCFENPQDIIHSLQELLPLLPAPQQAIIRDKALQLARTIKDPDRFIPGNLVPYFPEAERVALADEALQIARDSNRIDLFVYYFRDHLSKLQRSKVFNEAFQWAQSINEPFQRAEMMSYLALFLSPLERSEILEVALVNKQIHSPIWYNLAPYLTVVDFSKVLQFVRSIQYELEKSMMLSTLIPYLPPDLLAEVLDIFSTTSGMWFTEYISPLLERLPVNLMPNLLNLIRKLEFRGFVGRDRSIALIARYLPNDQLEEALGMVFNDAHPYQQPNESLGELALYLPSHRMTKVLNYALAITPSDSYFYSRLDASYNPENMERPRAKITIDRHKVLKAIGPGLDRWGKIAPVEAHAALCTGLQELCQQPRPKFLQDLVAFTPMILALAGDEAPQAAEGIYHAIQEVCRWWP